MSGFPPLRHPVISASFAPSPREGRGGEGAAKPTDTEDLPARPTAVPALLAGGGGVREGPGGVPDGRPGWSVDGSRWTRGRPRLGQRALHAPPFPKPVVNTSPEPAGDPLRVEIRERRKHHMEAGPPH